MSEHFDCAVVGAGVVGLAIARQLSSTGRSVLVLERHGTIGTETSSRNSEVIHAGIYHPAGSLKARLCVRGKSLLYDYLRERELPHSRLGKLIVAVTRDEIDRLDGIARFAAANGVNDLERVDRDALERLEPEIRGAAALWSPSTGIVDTHALMLSLQGDLEENGGMIALSARVDAIAIGTDRVAITVDAGGETVRFTADTVVNASGLGAATLAKSITNGNGDPAPALRFAKGNYFVYRGAAPFSHLIYPLPVDGGLGVHATLDLAGSVRFGPDVEWIDSIDYDVDATRSGAFRDAIRNYWPGLPEDGLAPGYAGIRPKLSGPGEPVADFLIVRSARTPRGGLVQLFGIESPGLTSCLAIAEYVDALLHE